MIETRDKLGHRPADQKFIQGGQPQPVLLLVLDAEHAEPVPAERVAQPVLGDGRRGVLAGLHLDDAPVVQLLDVGQLLPEFVLDPFVQLAVHLHDAELAVLVAAHGVDLVVVGDEEGVVFAERDVLDLEVLVRVDHARVLDLRAELRVHAELPLFVVAPEEEAFRLGDACGRVLGAVDHRELAAFELSRVLALQVFLGEAQLVFVVRTPAEDPAFDREGHCMRGAGRHRDYFFVFQFGDDHRFPGYFLVFANSELTV